MKNKSKIVLGVVVAILLIIVILCGILLPLLRNEEESIDKGANDTETNTLIQKVEYKETLDDVNKDFSFDLKSDKELSTLSGNVKVLDQNGTVADCSLQKTKNDVYRLVAPQGGYNEGYTYKVKLLNDSVKFADSAYSDRRDITFTIFKDDIEEVEYKESVIDLSDEESYTLNDNNSINVSSSLVKDNNIQIDSIILIPVYDENGFSVLRAYKVVGLSSSSDVAQIEVEEPNTSEVYDELEVKGVYKADYSWKNIKAATEVEIEDQIAKSTAISSLMTMSTAKENKKPEIKVSLHPTVDSVVLQYSITIPDIFAKVDFKVEGEIEVKLGTKASISLINGTFDFGAYLSYKNTYSYSLILDKKIGGEGGVELCKKAMAKLTDVLNKKAGNKQIEIDAFSMFLPTPVPALGFSFDVKLVFKLELKVQLEITFIDEFSVEVGAKRDSDGLNTYFNKISSSKAKDIEFSGSITAKLGLEVKFSGSIAGILKAGVSFELGIYGKLAGSVKVGTLEDVTANYGQLSASVNDKYCYALYFEIGLYTELSLFAEVDLKFWSTEAKLTLLETEIPIFSVGYTQEYEIELENESVVLDNNGKAKFPSVILHTKDMFTGEESQAKLSSKDLRNVLKINFKDDKCRLDTENNIIADYAQEEFTAEIEISVRSWQKYFDIIFAKTNGVPSLSLETGKRGIIHYELGTLFTQSAILKVTKNPIALDSVNLSFNRVTNDPEYALLHPEYSADELNYNYREDIDGISDFQIGRLIEVIPTILPSNASYKSLSYEIIRGAEYIVDGVNGIETYTKNGIDYARFRIIDDLTAIGNINGELDLSKEIVIQAYTDGYTGNYSSWNVISQSTQRVFASPIPAISYDFTPVIDENNVNQTSVQAGDEISFGIDSSSVLPRNASRGIFGQECMSLLSGPAVITEEHTVIVNNNAKVGEQIVVLSSLSGIEKEYYLNVVKCAVETVTLESDIVEIKPGGSASLVAKLNGANGVEPSINEVVYVVTSGKEFINITSDELIKNKANITFSDDIPIGTVVKVIAIADGQRSNEMNLLAVKIPVESVFISSETGMSVDSGENVVLNVSCSPSNASYLTPTYIIVEGSEFADIDSGRGIITVKKSCVGGETIKIKCIVDGVQSNEITLTVNIVDVTYVQFPIEYSMVRDGQSLLLDAFVNPDATNQNVSYEITEGNNYAEIQGNNLVIYSGLSTEDMITVRAISAGNSSIYVEKTFIIYAELASLSINGQFDSVKLLQTEQAVAVVTDKNGETVDNSLVTFTITDSVGRDTNLAIVDENGLIKFASAISEEVNDLNLILKATVGGETLSLYIEIIIPPQYIEILTENGGQDSIELKPKETVNLLINYVKQNNAVTYDYVELIAEGNICARLKTNLLGFGLKSYKIVVQVNSEALTGETATVKVKCYLSGIAVTSRAFTITVGRITQSVNIANSVDSLNIGEHYTLIAEGYPQNNNYTPKYEFADSISNNYATINETTGEIIIENNDLLIGHTIQVVAIIDGIRSDILSIGITSAIKEISISCGNDSEGVQFISEYGFYILHPSGRLVLSADVVGGENASEIHYSLDTIGLQYFEIEDDVITVKDVEINSGINATVIAYSDNGVISNTLCIYVPTTIKTVADWLSIRNNVTGYYVLGNDIDFNGVVYSPIEVFGGIIDGAGFSLKNIKVTELSANNCFGLIEQNYGMIVNLSLKNFSAKITESNENAYFGGVAAKNFGYIINCFVQVKNGDSVLIQAPKIFVGAITGYNAGTVRLCYSQAYIDSFGVTGGIVGFNDKTGSVKDCYNRDYICAYIFDRESCILGIIGKNIGLSNNNVNYGKIFERDSWSYIIE